MNEEQTLRLRIILDIEGFLPSEINATLANIAKNPAEAIKWEKIINEWKLITETKQ